MFLELVMVQTCSAHFFLEGGIENTQPFSDELKLQVMYNS